MIGVRTDKLNRYKRLIGVVLLNGRDLNIKQLETGDAWHYKPYANEHSAAERQTYSEGAECSLNPSRTVRSMRKAPCIRKQGPAEP